MKFFVIAFAFLTISGRSFSQWLTQSAEGNGSFLFKGTNVTFDLAKTDFSFTLNNLSSPVKVSAKKDNHLLFYGGGVNAKAREGLANLFSGGELVPAGNVNGYLGFQFSNSYNKLYRDEEARLSAQLTKIKDQQLRDFVSKMSGKIDEEILSSMGTDSTIIKKIKKEWKEKLSKSQPKSFFDYLKTYKPDNDSVASIISNLLVAVETMVKENARGLEHISTLLTENREENISSKLWRFSIFTFGGVDASSFKRVQEIDSSNFARSFIRENYRGGFWGAGLNFQINRWKFGATYAYRKTSNVGLLDNAEYKLTSVVTNNGQTLTKEIAINAFTGLYGEVEINEVNADIIYSLNLGNSSDTYALLNAYYRGQVFSRSKDLLPGANNVGIGSYFYTRKSKFLGGLYLELPDVQNYFKGNQPVATQGIKSAVRKLTFGIVGKYSLNALISRQ